MDAKGNAVAPFTGSAAPSDIPPSSARQAKESRDEQRADARDSRADAASARAAAAANRSADAANRQAGAAERTASNQAFGNTQELARRFDALPEVRATARR